MKTRAAAAATTSSGGATPTPSGQLNRGGGGGRARDKIRDSTNNQSQPPPPMLTMRETFKKRTTPKKKKRKTKTTTTTTPSQASLLHKSLEATSYLHRWENNRSEWRFEKLQQIWLLKNALNRELISDEYFEILLNYLTLIKGAAKTTTLQEMRGHMGSYEVKYGAGGQPTDVENSEYERARLIVQMLGEEED